MKPIVTDDKPAVDRASLQDFLAAAYVVQKHNDRLQAGQPPENGHSQILKDILELQEQLQSPHFDLREKMAAVARRVREMAQASGSAVGLLLGDDLEYYAATGSAAKQAGARVPQDSCLSRECLRTGQILQCSAAETDPRLDQALCRSLGVKAFIAVPVKHAGKLVGVVEVHFSEFNSFHDQEVRTCELVSSLVADAIFNSGSEEPVKKLPAAPAAAPPTVAANISLPVVPHNTDALLAALDKIRPRLEQLARKSLDSSQAPPASDFKGLPDEPEPATASACRNCGHGLAEDEAFCGICGSARQPKNIWSSLLDMQRKAEQSAHQNGKSADPFEDSLGVFPSELEEIVAKFSGEPAEPKSSEVALPAFAQELVSPGHSSEDEERAPEQALHHAEIKNSSVLKQENLAVPASDVDEVAAEPARPFLVERSSDSDQTAEEPYPPFVGFASENNLLSLPAESESEVSSASGETEATQDLPVPVAGDETSPILTHPLNSAVKAKEWLEAGRPQESRLVKLWREQRANVYLVAAALLLVTVLLGWASPSQPPSVVGKVTDTGKTPATDAPPEPELTLSEKLLVSLGLAEPPRVETAEPGNPNTQVWIDVHTALYYCPGADLYGKTPGGRMAPQHQAQLDQFQPAMRKACN